MVLAVLLLNRAKSLDGELLEAYVPIANNLAQLDDKIESSIEYSERLVADSRSADQEKLKALVGADLPRLKHNLDSILNAYTSVPERESIIALSVRLDQLLRHERDLLKAFAEFGTGGFESAGRPIVQNNIRIVGAESRGALGDIRKVFGVRVAAKRAERDGVYDWLFVTLIATGAIVILFVIGAIFWTSRTVLGSLKGLQRMVNSLGKGEMPKQRRVMTKDAVGDMTDGLNRLVTGLEEVSAFARTIGEGNFEATYTPLSDKDLLGQALINMRDNLKEVTEMKRRQSWATEGFAKFGELLRDYDGDQEAFLFELISQLARYLGAIQGGIFTIQENKAGEKTMVLGGCYAYDRHKYVDTKFKKGESLVGQCWQEADMIYMTKVPDDYLKITSGIGESKPSCLLIVPLMVNEEVHGVVELASFDLLEDYQIDFVQKLGESIASTLANLSVNRRTAVLLKESNEMAEQLRAQEEIMRQNTEELHATQEEMQRGIQELSRKLQAVEAVTGELQFDEDGNITNLHEVMDRITAHKL